MLSKKALAVFLVLCFAAFAAADTYQITITPTAGDTTPPVISGIAPAKIDSNSATIAWATDEASDSKVFYGTSSGHEAQSRQNTNLGTAHSMELTGLASETTYYYYVSSCDASNNCSQSSETSFRTLSAYQPPSCLPGQMLCGNTCIVPVCTGNSQCPSDGNPLTNEVCQNPATCSAACVSVPVTNCSNGPVSQACQCGGTLVTSGLCCNNAITTPVCTSASQCNDNLGCTSDACNNPNTCTAVCAHTTMPRCRECGNGRCEKGESNSNCPQDCPKKGGGKHSLGLSGIIDTGEIQVVKVEYPETTATEEFFVDVFSPSGGKVATQTEDGSVAFPVNEKGEYIVKAYNEGLTIEQMFTAKSVDEIALPSLNPNSPITIVSLWLFVIPVLCSALFSVFVFKFVIRKKNGAEKNKPTA
ncbi:MAG: fibronectin type III domain-containing protein [Candidatus Diapherotrites archaeon]